MKTKKKTHDQLITYQVTVLKGRKIAAFIIGVLTTILIKKERKFDKNERHTNIKNQISRIDKGISCNGEICKQTVNTIGASAGVTYRPMTGLYWH
jgi:hypothetical protein